MKKAISIVLTTCLVLLLATGMAAAAQGGNSKGHSTGGTKGNTVSSHEKGNQITTENKGDLIIKENSQNKNSLKTQTKLTNQVRKSIKQKLETRVQNQNTRKDFKDVQNHWATAAINNMVALGLFSGYPDGTFKPDQSINQAEAITIVMRLAVTTEEAATTPDETAAANDSTITADDPVDTTDDSAVTEDDTPTDEELEDVPDWAQDSANAAYKKGFINLDRFHSQVQASRAQTAVWIAKALELEPVDTTEMPFTDGLQISPEDTGYIIALYQEGILKGTPDGKFNPNSAITRAEIATIMQQIVEEQPDDSTTVDETTDTSTDNTTTTDTSDNTNSTDTTSNTEQNTTQDDTNTSTGDSQPSTGETAQ